MQLTITRKEAELIEALLRPRAHLLHELLEIQIQALPPGDDSWADTQDALRVANGALVKVRNAQVIKPKPAPASAPIAQARVSRHTKAGSNGKWISCPHCGHQECVGHFSWSSLACRGCRRMVDKTDWLIAAQEAHA